MFQHLHLERPLVFFDLETTGLDPQRDRVVEVAALRLAPGQHPRGFSRLVDPGRPIPPRAAAIHGLTDADVAGCPSFHQTAPELEAFLRGADLAGFGLRPFDLPVLVAEFRRAGRALDLRHRAVVDVQTLFHQCEPRDLAAAVRRYCGREHADAHQAGWDVVATAAVLEAMLGQYPDLPRHPSGLHRHTVPADVAGWFRRDGDALLLTRGKYRGRPLGEVAAEDPGYLRWLLAQPVLPDTQELVAQALGLPTPTGEPR